MSVKRLFQLAMLSLILGACQVNQKQEPVEIDYLGSPLPENIPEVYLPGVISKQGRFEMGFTMSPDGKTMVYGVAHESDTGQTNLYFIQKQQVGWSLSKTDPLPQNHNVFFPMFGPEGKQFYFARGKPDGDTDLWMAELSDGAIKGAKPFVGEVNSAYREAGHGQAQNGTFLFTSNRDQAQPWGGDVYQRHPDGTVEKVETLSSEWDEESLFLSPKGDFVIVQAWKPEFNGKHDLYISYRMKNGAWSNSERLNEEINTAEIEQRPFVGPDLKYLFFSRMSTKQNREETLFDSDIFWLSTKKVFGPYVYNPTNAFEVVANEPFTLDLPKDLFRHVTQETLEIGISLANGSVLPDSFQFDSESMQLKGTLSGKESLALTIKATDLDGQSASLDMELLVRANSN